MNNGQLYRVWCRFEPNHINLPAGRRGQWRVVACWSRCGGKLVAMPARFSKMHEQREIGIASTRPYSIGCIIRPHKELNRVFQARKALQ